MSHSVTYQDRAPLSFITAFRVRVSYFRFRVEFSEFFLGLVSGWEFRGWWARAEGMHDRLAASFTTLETTRGQIDGFFSQLPFKCYIPAVASVGY